MKKNLLVLAASILAGAAILTSCNGDGENYVTESYLATNLITSANPAYAPTASDGLYTARYDLNTTTVGFSTTSLSLNGQTISFATSDVPYKTAISETAGYYNTFSTADAGVTGGASYSVTDLSARVYSNFYYYQTEIIPDLTRYDFSTAYLVASYRVGDFLVRTFRRDSFFVGETITTTPTETGPQTYTDTKMVYRFVMDLTKNTASLVIYNTKFTEDAPTVSAIWFQDLKLTFNNNGYVISGTDVAPKVLGSMVADSEDYKMKSITLRSVNSSLTNISCDFVMEDNTSGGFSGSCTLDTQLD